MKPACLLLAVFTVLGTSGAAQTTTGSVVARFAGTWTMTYDMDVLVLSGGVYSSGREKGKEVVELRPSGGALSYDVKVVKNGQVTDHWTINLKETAGTSNKVLLTVVLHGNKQDFRVVDALPLSWFESSGFAASENEPAADGKVMRASITFGPAGSHTWNLPAGGTVGGHAITFERKQ
jgi:hypothetical protein